MTTNDALISAMCFCHQPVYNEKTGKWEVRYQPNKLEKTKSFSDKTDALYFYYQTLHNMSDTIYQRANVRE